MVSFFDSSSVLTLHDEFSDCYIYFTLSIHAVPTTQISILHRLSIQLPTKQFFQRYFHLPDPLITYLFEKRFSIVDHLTTLEMWIVLSRTLLMLNSLFV